MSSIDPSASEIGDLKIVSKVKSMFEVKPENDVQYVRGKKNKPEPVAETNGLENSVEEKQTEVVEQEVVNDHVEEEVKEVVVEEQQPAVEPEPVVEPEPEPEPVVEQQPEEKPEEKHVTFNEENADVTNEEKLQEKTESESKEDAPANTGLQNDVSEAKETNQNQ